MCKLSTTPDPSTGEIKTTLLGATLDELATAAITAEIASRFAEVDPLAIINVHQDAVNAKAEELGLLQLLPEDRAAIANRIDEGEAIVFVRFP